MINFIPVIGWFLSLCFAISMAIPFWFLWTACGYGQLYFYWLPPLYLHPGFWDCVCCFIIISILKAVLLPSFVSSSSNK